MLECKLLKIVTFTTLYPDAIRPGHGIFVENRLRQLVASEMVQSKVVAPVPWFPFRHKYFGEYAIKARIPLSEKRHGIEVMHPRYPLIPKIGMSLSPLLMAMAVLPLFKRLIKQGYDFDVIDAHYFYPDGVAAALLGKWLKKPVVITGRGSDLHLIPRYFIPKKQIIWAAQQAKALITVCQALKDILLKLGIPGDKITVLRNGVDLQLFRPPSDRQGLRKELKISGKSILSVGRLIELKGQHLIIEALKKLPDVSLYIAGDGQNKNSLKMLSRVNGVQDRVIFLGQVNHESLPDYYGAVDILVLASSREGWANVLLESMACGTPVVATEIWGNPEIIATSAAGILCNRSSDDIAKAIAALFNKYPDRSDTRHYAEQFSWEEVTQGQINIFSSIGKG